MHSLSLAQFRRETEVTKVYGTQRFVSSNTAGEGSFAYMYLMISNLKRRVAGIFKKRACASVYCIVRGPR